jgi:predicted 2-oxoglutarate/Fe(II)-dependent dioxygenase YbiX
MINIIEKLFDEDYCDYVYDYAKNNFVKELRGDSVTWRIQKNTNIDFENEIKSKMSHLINFNNYRLNKLFLTEYYKNESLIIHLDKGSTDNLIIQLTSGFTGGEFIIEDKLFNFNKGDCVQFDGSKLKHGLVPVKSGIRAALNFWITPLGKKLL